MAKIYISDDKTGREGGKSVGKYERKKNYISFYGTLYSINGYGFVIMNIVPFKIDTNIYKGVNITFSNKSRGQFLFYIYNKEKTYITKLGSFTSQRNSITKRIIFSDMIKQYRGTLYATKFNSNKGVIIDSIAVAITRSRQPPGTVVPLNFYVDIKKIDPIK